MSIRGVNILMGAWLIASAFIWPHAATQLWNALLCGIACIVIAAVAMRVPGARYLSAVLGTWLFDSAFLLGHSKGTEWNHILVGMTVFFVAFTPTARLRTAQPGGGLPLC